MWAHDTLHADVMIRIFRFCDLKTLVRLRAVSSCVRILSQDANIWKHRLPPGLVHNILPQDRCDAAIYHSDLLVTPDIQLESEFKIIQSVPEMPKHLPDPHRPGSARRRRILAIFNGQEDYGPFCNVRMDALYLANRTGVLVMFIEPKKPNFDQKVEEMVFHDFLNNEKITLSPSLPQGTVRSIPGTNLVVIVSDQDHIGLYIWDENHKDFNMVGDTTDVFRNAVGIFTGTPRAITSSWGVVLTGFGGEDSPTFLQYRLNHDGSGLTFSNGCHWRDEGIESYGPRDISNSDQDICWTTLLGTSVLTYENDDGNEHFFAANIFETNTNETGWMHWEGIETDDVAMPCGDRVIRFDRGSYDYDTVKHNLASSLETYHQKISKEAHDFLDYSFMYSPLPLQPARMMYFRTLYEGGDTFVMFDPLRGRVSAYKWDQDYRHLDGEPFVVVFEDDVGGSTVPHWEEHIVITAVSIKKK